MVRSSPLFCNRTEECSDGVDEQFSQCQSDQYVSNDYHFAYLNTHSAQGFH